MFPGFGFGSGRSGEGEPQYRSRMGRPPERGVVLLGAGASVAAGCPLMRGFIDRARDYAAAGVFSDEEREDVDAALALYTALRSSFSITEEDVENVETLLSLADLVKVVGAVPVDELNRPGLADHLRRFVDAVVTKSVSVLSPSAPEWLHRREDGAFVFKQLARILAHHGGRVVVLTTNYDCLVEYACHCLGVPFTYHGDLVPGGAPVGAADGSPNGGLADDGRGTAVEILKLHGSSNWLRCPNPACVGHHALAISPLRHRPRPDAGGYGYLEVAEPDCRVCGRRAVPFIVPPTWAKDVDHAALRSMWSRALEVLSEADVFVAAGFSLPESDAHLRHLLHVGLSSGRLRQAVAVVGSDEATALRWSSLFRESWRQARLEVRLTTFARAMDTVLIPALVAPDHIRAMAVANPPGLPLVIGADWMKVDRKRWRDVVERNGPQLQGLHPSWLQEDWNWVEFAARIRGGQALTSEGESVRQALDSGGLLWTPADDVLPVHGRSLASPAVDQTRVSAGGDAYP
jgi:hypothetical protein